MLKSDICQFYGNIIEPSITMLKHLSKKLKAVSGLKKERTIKAIGLI